jgi:hypothetical protein
MIFVDMKKYTQEESRSNVRDVKKYLPQKLFWNYIRILVLVRKFMYAKLVGSLSTNFLFICYTSGWIILSFLMVMLARSVTSSFLQKMT